MHYLTSNECIHQILCKRWQKHVFLSKDDEVWEKYDEFWDVIKNKLSIKFQSKPIYNQKYVKAKVREFDDVIKTNFLGNDTPNENIHYT